MRQLTDSERKAMEVPLRQYWVERDGLLPKETRAFETGFIAGLDHSAAEIADLQAERDELKAALKPFIALWPDDLGKFDDKPIYGNTNAMINVGHFKAARRALGK